MSEILRQSEAVKRWSRSDSGASTGIGEYWRTIANNDPEFKSVHMVVELVMGSDVVVRVCAAGSPIVTTSTTDGHVYAYLPAMSEEPGINMPLSFGSQNASPRSVSLSIHGSVIKPAEIIRRGRVLAGIAEVSLQVHGGDYDKRLVLMRGDMNGGVKFGTEDEWVDVQITDSRVTQKHLIPEIASDTDRWPELAEEDVGTRYPVVINGYKKIPCLYTQNVTIIGKEWLIADGVNFSEVEMYVNGTLETPGSSTFDPWTTSGVQDALGRNCTRIKFDPFSGTFGDNPVVHVSLETTNDKLNIVECIKSLLIGYTSLGHSGINHELFSEAQSSMPGIFPNILINSSGSDTTDVISVIEGGLLSSFPMIHMVYEGRGMGPIVFDRRNGTSGATFEAGKFPLIERISDVQEEGKDNCFNQFEYRYDYDIIVDNYTGIVKRDPSNSPICSLSETMLGGKIPMDVVESPYIVDDASANYVSDWYVAHYGLPSYTVQWRCHPSILITHRRGQNITFDDPKFGFDNALATIESFDYKRGDCAVTIRIWHPAWNSSLS